MPTFVAKKRSGTDDLEKLFDGMSEAGAKFVDKYNNYTGSGAKLEDLYIDVFSVLNDPAGLNLLVTYGAAEGEREIHIDGGKIKYTSADSRTYPINIKGEKDDNGKGNEKVTMNWPKDRPDLTGAGSGKYLDDICQIIANKYGGDNAKTRAFLLGVILMSKCR